MKNAGYTLDYTTANQLNSMLYPNGNRQSYTYEDHGPIQTITLKNSGDTILETLGYTYDANRNILTYSDKDGSHQFTYDGLDRLTQGDYPAASGLSDDSFVYDNVGNREVPGDLAANTYNANNELLSLQSGAVTFTYDDDGNQLNKTDTAVPANNRTYTYDLNNRLIGFSQGSTVASYGYDPSGRRLFKTVNGTTTWFLWDGTQLLAEYTTSGSATALTTRYDYLPGEFAPLQIETDNSKYSVHTDHLATPKLLTDGTGQIVWRSVRAAFGEMSVDEDVDGNGVVVEFNIRFPGQYFDGESELHYNYFRDYDPSTGRYIQSDPIGLAGGMNTYAYVSGNPVNLYDFFGLCACQRPTSSNFWNAYPNYNNFNATSVWNLIGGSLNQNYGPYSNSCAARVSHGLNNSGAPIQNSPQHQTNRNWGGNNNGQRYIISAQQLNNYLQAKWGAPNQVLTSPGQLQSLQNSLSGGQAALVVSNGHAAVVTSTYTDPYVSGFLGNVWLLPTAPTQGCSCP